MIQETYVYLIAHLDGAGECTAPVKIGYSSFPDKRLATLQTGNPSRLVMMFKLRAPSVELARQSEAYFHRVAASDRLSGEWFSTAPIKALAGLSSAFAALILQDVRNDKDAELLMEWSGVMSAAEMVARASE